MSISNRCVIISNPEPQKDVDAPQPARTPGSPAAKHSRQGSCAGNWSADALGLAVMNNLELWITLIIGVPALLVGVYAHAQFCRVWLGNRLSDAADLEKRMFPET